MKPDKRVCIAWGVTWGKLRVRCLFCLAMCLFADRSKHQVEWASEWDAASCRPGFGRQRQGPKKNFTLKEFNSLGKYKVSIPAKETGPYLVDRPGLKVSGDVEMT